MAGRAWADGGGAAALRSLVIHTPHGDARYRLPWTFSTFDYRELCALLWADCDARFETAKVEGLAEALGGANGSDAIAVEPTGGRSPRRSSSTRSAGGGSWPGRRATSRPTRLSHAGSRSIPRRRRGPGDLDRPPLRPGRLRLVLPGRRGDADRGRLLRPEVPRARDDRAARRRPGARQRPLPGQLDPPQAARGDRARGVLHRRLGGPLPAADRRGDPHRALLRHGAGTGAARGRRRAPDPRARGRAATPPSTTRTRRSSSGCCGCRSWCRGSRRAWSAR